MNSYLRKFVATFLLIGAGCGASAADDEQCGTQTAREDPNGYFSAFIGKWNDAWNRHDLEAIRAMMTPDVHYEDPGILGSGVAKGQQQVIDWLAVMFKAFPDLQFVDRHVFVSTDGQRAVWEWRAKGTFKNSIEPIGSFQTPVFAPTGNQFSMPGADIIWVENDLICHVRSMWDPNPYVKQLGLAPPASAFDAGARD
jgi:steroid delta-isomerase-like uncharacterized protein